MIARADTDAVCIQLGGDGLGWVILVRKGKQSPITIRLVDRYLAELRKSLQKDLLYAPFGILNRINTVLCEKLYSRLQGGDCGSGECACLEALGE